MTKNQNQVQTTIKWLGFITAVLIASLLHFRQVFVFPNYQPIPFTYLIKNFKTAVYQLTHHPILPQDIPIQSSDLTIETNCPDTCQFIIKNSADNSVIKTIPAIVDVDPSGRLSSLKLQFFDPQHGLIGYQKIDTDYPTFYVINYQPDLLQTIQLNLHDNVKFEFVNYYPDTQQMHFSSTNQTTGTEKDFLYSATKPELFEVTGQI